MSPIYMRTKLSIIAPKLFPIRPKVPKLSSNSIYYLHIIPQIIPKLSLELPSKLYPPTIDFRFKINEFIIRRVWLGNSGIMGPTHLPILHFFFNDAFLIKSCILLFGCGMATPIHPPTHPFVRRRNFLKKFVN